MELRFCNHEDIISHKSTCYEGILTINYTISPINEVAVPMPSEYRWQDGGREAEGTQEAEFKNASQSGDWFIVPND